MSEEQSTTTQIQLPKELVEQLHELKAYGETYADVIRRLIQISKPSKSKKQGV